MLAMTHLLVAAGNVLLQVPAHAVGAVIDIQRAEPIVSLSSGNHEGAY